MSKKKEKQLNILAFTILADCVLIEPLAAESVSGLVKPESYDDKPEFGLVIKAGQGKLLENGEVVPLKMKEGDIVYFGKYSSIKIRSNGKDYLIIRDYDVMALLSNGQDKKKI